MSDKRLWFKHFSNAHDDPLINNLLSTKPEAVAYYWVLIELISWYGTDGRLDVSPSFIRSKLKINVPTFWRLLAHFQDRISAHCDQKDPTIIQLFCPKFLEIQGSWGGKRRSRSNQDASTCPGEDRSKKKDTPIVPTGDAPKTRAKKRSAKPVNNLTLDHPWLKIWNELVRGTFPLVESLSNWRAARLAALAGAATDAEWAQLVRWALSNPWLRGVPSSDGKKFTGMSIDTLLRDKNFHSYLEQAKAHKHSSVVEVQLKPGESVLDHIARNS